MSPSPSYSAPFSQPPNVVTSEQILDAKRIEANFPHTGEGLFARLTVDGKDCVLKRFRDGNQIDGRYREFHGGAISYLADQIDEALLNKNIRVSGPKVLFQDSQHMLTRAVTAGDTDRLALNFNHVWAAISHGRGDYEMVAALYGKSTTCGRPFDADARAILVELSEVQRVQVKQFNAQFRGALSPRGEVATAIDTHFLVKDFNVTPSGSLEMSLVLIDLK